MPTDPPDDQEAESQASPAPQSFTQPAHDNLLKENAFLKAGSAKGLAAPMEALALVDLSSLSVNELGEVAGLAALFDDLKAKQPTLFHQQPPALSPGLAQQPDQPAPRGEAARQQALASGLTRDIHAYRQSKR